MDRGITEQRTGRTIMMMRRKTALWSRNEGGFTLIEILVVVVLIGIMMTVLIKSVAKNSEIAKAQLNVTMMQKVKQALSQYRLQYNTYPSKLEDMIKPSSDVIKNGGVIFTPLVDEGELLDIWKQRYIYKAENNGRTYSLKSLGADGAEGGEGANQDVLLHP